MKEIMNKIGIKKIITIIVIIIVIIILFMVGALMYNKMFYKKSYAEIEKIMVDASKKYYDQNKERLPQNEGEITSIEVNELVKQNYMKNINEYLKNDEEKCTGKVNITKINNNYKHTPKLECDNYKSKYIVEYIKENEKIVKTGDGLYELNSELVYRGENVNNYIKFANYNWRIVKIKDNKVKIILDEKIKEESAIEWDDRYNEDKESRIGINKYEVSRIKDYLNLLYNEKKLFTDEQKLLISSTNAEIGKRSITDESKDGSAEKSNILSNQYITLLPAYDYLNASTDSNCKSLNNESCNNYNYLASNDYSWWLLTANASNTYEVYKYDWQTINSSKASSSAKIKPVIVLTEDTFYVSGDGTKNNPYEIK